MKTLRITPLTKDAFAPFGDVLELRDAPDKIINQGLCGRHHDLARMDFGPDGQAGISLFDAEQRSLPLKLDLVERHPEGSQAFLPMGDATFLVVVAEDDAGAPVNLKAFVTAPGQGVNYHRNTWHGVLMPLSGSGLFAVVDRIGRTPNLEEYSFETPFLISE